MKDLILGNIVFEDKFYDNSHIVEKVLNVDENLSYIDNIGENEIIALYMNRTPELIITILTLLEKQIPFVPIDIEFPKQRINSMLSDISVKTIITTENEKNKFKNYNVICIEKLLVKVPHNNEKKYSYISNIAYVLFTSGTTGNPKAVKVTRKGFANFCRCMFECFFAGKSIRIGCFTNYTFDIFFLEAVVGMYGGASVVLANNEEVDNSRKLINLIRRQRINMLQFTPSRLRMLQILEPNFEFLDGVEQLLIGGEQFPTELLYMLQNCSNLRIYNMYGPTETTIWSSFSELTNKESVTIGKPIRNTVIFIMSDKLIKTERGEIGEICIAGDGLAEGYINNQELTDKAFCYSELENKKIRIYRTGDLGYYDTNNELVCLGRRDSQIKLYGHRIELEDIDANIIRIRGVKNSVTCFDRVNNKLVCFLIVENTNENNVSNSVKELLPAYMCPSKYIIVDKFKYTTSGKIMREGMLAEYLKKYSMEVELYKSEDVFLKILSDVTKEPYSTEALDKLVSELNIDSIQYISFIVELENNWNITFDDEKLSINSFKKLKDIYDYVEMLESVL